MPESTTTAVSRINASISSVRLLEINSNRRMAFFFNDSTSAMYLKMGITASTTDFSVKIAAGGYLELPQPSYDGIIDAIWDAANGAAQVTEVV